MKMQRLTTPRAHENPSSTRSPPRTPVRRPANGSSKDTYLPKTPEKRKQRFESPPSGAGQRTRRLGNEIEAALAANSMPSLSLALLLGHRCRQEHLVMEAVIQTNLKTLRFLIESGATDWDETCCGERPLHVALKNCDVEDSNNFRMAELLLEQGACPQACSGDAADIRPPLHAAAWSRSVAATSLLLKYTADPNATDASGRTPLHELCGSVWQWDGDRFRAQEIASLLIRQGANPLKCGSQHETPKQLTKDPKMIRFWQRAEAWWTRFQLTLAVGRLQNDEANKSANLLPHFPGFVDLVLAFSA